jgi:hypothetical protein
MPANTAPIFTLTPNIGRVQIPTTNAQIKSDGTSAGTTTDVVYKAFTSGANGSFVDKVRFSIVATAAVTSVACVLRVYLSSVAAPGATIGGTDTWLVGEVSVPAIAAASTTVATGQYDVQLNLVVPTGLYLHVSQSIAQTTNSFWQAMAMGGDY